ncbi:MAG: rhodanese-like domain-containing protein [Vicinamibacterales bacterium]|nr:rhodanese-like domain-containing protein [Vicinamibacterales bacterium]
MSAFRSIAPAEAQAFVESGTAHVIDVRTPDEYRRLGHIPGAWLIPVDLIAAAPPILPRDDRPVLVCCEHGVRSVAACQWLAMAGVTPLLNMAGGMAAWTGPRVFGPGVVRGPSPWLLEHANLIPAKARALDLAAGRGRHALLLAASGFAVTAVDRDADALAALAEAAARVGAPLVTEVRDLETGDEVDLGEARFDLVLVFHYLHRPLFPAIVRALAPGGVLFYETFLAGQAERGHPKNPAFLLDPGELVTRVAPLTVLAQREGEVDGKLMASVVARRD